MLPGGDMCVYIYIYTTTNNNNNTHNNNNNDDNNNTTTTNNNDDNNNTFLSQTMYAWMATLPCWVFIKGGCSGRGVQWMGVVSYNTTAYKIK